MASMLAIVTMGTWRSVSTSKPQRSTDYRGHHEVRLFKIAVLNSYEYVDTTAVSEILGVEFDSTSYDSYVGVAQALYKYMLRLVHTVWSRNSHMYGYSYDIVANNSTLVHNIENDQHSQ
jgi:hypothetical protein